jgi:hypothetical protein
MSKIGKTKKLLQKNLKIITSREGTFFGPKFKIFLHFSSATALSRLGNIYYTNHLKKLYSISTYCAVANIFG